MVLPPLGSGTFQSTVDHGCLLLSILRDRFSLDGVASTWFHSYLSDRTQTFMSGHDRSSGPFTVSCSVLQGSVLGPIEFIAYSEDAVELFWSLQAELHLFAEDTQLYQRPWLSPSATLILYPRAVGMVCVAHASTQCYQEKIKQKIFWDQ